MTRRPPTIIYAHGGGRFGNQLLRFLHWIAWAIEHQGKFRIVDVAFWPYARLFATWRKLPGCGFPLHRGWSDRFAAMRNCLPARVLHHGEWRMQRWFAGTAAFFRPRCGVDTFVAPAEVTTRLDDPGFAQRVSQARWLVTTGWELSCWSWLERHQNEVRALFTPAPEYAKRCGAFMSGVRQKHSKVMGLMIRRGDYRDWAGGRYFFPLASYVRWVRELLALYPDQNVGIVVACDEACPPEEFSGLPVTWASGSINAGGHWFESFLELAACDVVVSPPSTFSACAAFMGDRPFWPLREAGQRLDPSQILPRHLFAAAEDPALAIAVR